MEGLLEKALRAKINGKLETEEDLNKLIKEIGNSFIDNIENEFNGLSENEVNKIFELSEQDPTKLLEVVDSTIGRRIVDENTPIMRQLEFVQDITMLARKMFNKNQNEVEYLCKKWNARKSDIISLSLVRASIKVLKANTISPEIAKELKLKQEVADLKGKISPELYEVLREKYE